MNTVIGYAERAHTGEVSFAGERVNHKNVLGLLVVAVVVAVGALGFLFYERSQMQETRARVALSELQPIFMLLKENEAILKELQAEPFTENDSGILESYLAKIRRDGVPKHADMKQKLDTLAENNTAIVTLIKAYAPQAKKPAFVPEANKFLYYAYAWRDRWNSVMEIFMAGGNYAAAGVPFPGGFPTAVDEEIATVK
jgi:hypothetical protein